MRGFKTIVTVGPAVLNKDSLKRIDALGDCIYRVNGAHVDEKQAARMIGQIKAALPDAKIMVDLPCNKIRTANLAEPIRFIKGESFILYDYQINYPKFYTHLKKGDIVRANDSTLILEVVEVGRAVMKLLAHMDGILVSNKGLHVRGIHKDIPFLFERDRRLMDIAVSCRVNYLSLSYIRTVEDICQAREALKGTDIHIIAKIETHSALERLDSILAEVESVLVDRGDLSTEIDILNLAATQEKIITAGINAGKDVYLATQFLKNMETKPVPLISEVLDLCKTVKSGIAGIQLSEETAIGRYPVKCVKLVFDAFNHNGVL